MSVFLVSMPHGPGRALWGPVDGACAAALEGQAVATRATAVCAGQVSVEDASRALPVGDLLGVELDAFLERARERVRFREAEAEAIDNGIHNDYEPYDEALCDLGDLLSDGLALLALVRAQLPQPRG